jgi:uncharacterized membrane-anchored protein
VTAVLIMIFSLTFVKSMPKVLLFWCAFILTRPFGATFGDLLTKTKEKGGFDLGTGLASLILLSLLVVFLMYNHLQQKKDLV